MNERKAGRELDAEIAEKVMGWTDIKTYLGNCPPSAHDGLTAMVPNPNGGEPGWQCVPHFSTTMIGAWHVVERLRRLPWYRGIEVTDVPTQGGKWSCLIYGKVDGVIGTTYVADTAQLAICLSALKATEKSQ